MELHPFPNGKDFAISFVDDTDLSTKNNIEPVYDFLEKYNIKGTKTVWVLNQKRTSAFRKKDERPLDTVVKSGSTIEDPDYLSFILDLKKKGIEIATHNIAAGNSYRKEIVEGINRFKEIFDEYPKINVFHERNIENLYAGNYKLDFWPLKLLERITDKSEYQGHIEGSAYFWGDVAKKRIKYMRLPFHTISAINTLKINPSMPFHDKKRPYVNYWFSSSDGSNCQKFIKLLSKKNIERLKRERGACIIYTHFAKGFTKKDGEYYKLNYEFANIIRSIVSYKTAWFPTATELLDRLLTIKKIVIEQRNFDLFIKNTGNLDLIFVTLLVNPDVVLVDDKNRKYRPSKDKKIIIDKLKAGSRMHFRSNRKAQFLIRGRKNDSISRFERLKVELYNYISLLKNIF